MEYRYAKKGKENWYLKGREESTKYKKNDPEETRWREVES